MGAAPLRQVAAPSSTLLKFLRAQQNGHAFFTSNAAVHYNNGISQSRIAAPRAASATQPFQRPLTTASAPFIPVHSSLFPFEGIWPRKNGSAPTSMPSGHGPGALATHGSRYAVSPFEAASIRRISTRQASDNGKRDYRRFWGFGKPKHDSRLHANDLPQLANFLDENSSLGRIVRPGNEMKLRCTEFDANGNVTLVNGEFKKSELIAKYGLLPRDLRKIDSSLLPHILVRPSAILINLLHLRVLIKNDRVLVFDAYGSTDSYTQSLFMYDLEGRLRASTATGSAQLPYEFRALEAVLISVTSGLEGEFEGVRDPVVRVLRELEEDIDREKLRHLLIYSKKLGTFEQKARLVRDAIDDLLEADDDLATMYLSEKVSGKQREEDDHTEIEMLLESYHKVCDEIVQVSGNLVSNIRNTEEVVRAILDANRNQLMLLDIKFSIGTLGLAGGTFIAALYGMNLKNFIEESDVGFWGVSVSCTVVSIVMLFWGMRKLKRTERLSMWGSGSSGRKGWASLGERPTEQMLSQMRRERIKSASDSHVVGDGNGSAHQHPFTPPLPPVPVAPRKGSK